MKIIKISGMAALCALLLSACNTIGGIGRDVESVGDAIGDAADDNK